MPSFKKCIQCPYVSECSTGEWCLTLLDDTEDTHSEWAGLVFAAELNVRDDEEQ